MVETTVKLGPKGQLVIPKLFRDEYGFMPGHDVVLHDEADGVKVKRSVDALQILDGLRAKAMVKRVRHPDPHAIYEQYETRARRAGVLK